MNQMIRINILLILLIIGPRCYGQVDMSTAVFGQDTPLKIKTAYAIKNVRKATNDSTYMNTIISYEDAKGKWQALDAKIKKRGNFRLKTCYYPPLKIKFSKKAVVNSPFSENRKFKMVMPCLRDANANDLIVKEYLAYKMYEVVAPYHFKTRMLDINFEEKRSKKSKARTFKGFLIEDIDDVAKRLGANRLKRKVHPLEQDAEVSIINSFFQCMIGNTDFSTGYQHNEKLIFKDGESYPLPYDFDMSGLVNAPYATVSKIQGKQLPIEKVTQRLYRGFIRDRAKIFEVRTLFSEKKQAFLEVMDAHANFFEDKAEFERAKTYVAGFFKMISDEDRFEDMILNNLREKMEPIDTIPHK